MPVYGRTGRGGELHREMPDPARRTIDQHLAAEQQPALAQRMQRGQPGHRQGCRLRIGNAVRQRRDRMARRAHTLRPRTGRQHADHARTHGWAAAVSGGRLDHTCKIPAGPCAGLGRRQGAIDLAAVQRNRRDADGDVVGCGRRQRDVADRQPGLARRIDNDGADHLRHRLLPVQLPLKRGLRRSRQAWWASCLSSVSSRAAKR